MSEKERNAMIDELSAPEVLICPDVDYIQVMNSVKYDSSHFYYMVWPTDDATEEIIKNTIVI